MKIIFMGTPEFAIPALQALINSYHEVIGVYTAPPKPKGRGMHLQKSPVHILAESNNIPVYTPTTLRSEEIYNHISNIEADIIIVVAYGFIVPRTIIDSKKYGCLNIHPSKLPRFRGAAPLQRTIINGDEETAVCIIQMDEGLDTGDIILQEDISLPFDITFTRLHDLCADKGATLLLKVLDGIETLPRRKQKDEGVVYAHKLAKEEGQINWNDSAEKIDRKIRGMNPWPGAYCSYNGNMLKILESSLFEDFVAGFTPGTIIPEKSLVVCGKGAIELVSVKRAGSGAMSFDAFLRGSNSKILSMDM